MEAHESTGSSQSLLVTWRTNLKCTYLLASVALASVTSAQVSVDWVATHDVAPGVHNAFQAVAVDATGRVAVAGGSSFDLQALSVSGDYETCLYGSDGTLLWSRSLNINAYDRATAVAFDGTGGLFVAGSGEVDFQGPATHRTLLHYDAVGNLLWSNTLFPTSYSNTAEALALCSNGDVILAGAINSKLSLERFDPAGNVLWSWTQNNYGLFNQLLAVAVGPGGDVWATGCVHGNANYEIVVVRVTSAGVPVWVRSLNSNQQDDWGRALVVDAAGNVTVAGSIAGNAAIARWDPAGNLAWLRTYGETAYIYDTASQIALDPFGRIVAAGQFQNFPTDKDSAVWCLDTAGSLIWNRTWDGGLSGSNDLGNLVVDAMGAVWLCGSFPNYLEIASWDSTGAFRWSWRTPPGTRTYASAAAVSGNDVIVAGGSWSTGPGARWDGLVLRLSRTTVEYCFGDGSSTPCPCANASVPEQHAGCANSLGLGARLVDKGTSSLAADTLVLEGSQMPAGNALYFQGTITTSGGAGAHLGDGLSCVGGTLIRLGSRTNVAGASQFPDFWGPSVSVRGLVTTPGTRTYQTWYRDASVFCTTANFNFSNGLLITWTL
jgi:hypothetical protein